VIPFHVREEWLSGRSGSCRPSRTKPGSIYRWSHPWMQQAALALIGTGEGCLEPFLPSCWGRHETPLLQVGGERCTSAQNVSFTPREVKHQTRAIAFLNIPSRYVERDNSMPSQIKGTLTRRKCMLRRVLIEIEVPSLQHQHGLIRKSLRACLCPTLAQ
jgi:hypothetical protein